MVHGVGIHEYYSPEWQKKAFSTREYLFDVYPARASVYGTRSMDEFLAYGPRLSLLARGMLERASAPMLLVNGERDSQQPIADLYLLMKHGDPKDVWVNPQGGHMGRSERWPDGKVRSEVVEPWVLRHLENRGQSPISSSKVVIRWLVWKSGSDPDFPWVLSHLK